MEPVYTLYVQYPCNYRWIKSSSKIERLIEHAKEYATKHTNKYIYHIHANIDGGTQVYLDQYGETISKEEFDVMCLFIKKKE